MNEWVGRRCERGQRVAGAAEQKALFGSSYSVTREHGQLIEFDRAELATSTIHPSAILRRTTERERREEMERFVEDLRRVGRLLNPDS